MLQPLMSDIHDHLYPHGVFDPRRVAAIHCKAGKGRTGMIIVCWMLYSGLFASYEAELALRFYAVRRVKNQKGVTIPSQIRYCKYFARWLRQERGLTRFPHIHTRNPLLLQSVRLQGIPKACTPGKDVWFKMMQMGPSEGKYTSKGSGKCVVERRAQEDCILFHPAKQATGTGLTAVDHDVHVQFYVGGLFESTKLFAFWFNTRFVGILGRAESMDQDPDAADASAAAPLEKDGDEAQHLLTLTLTKPELDKACKDVQHKAYPDNFRVELTFSSP